MLHSHVTDDETYMHPTPQAKWFHGLVVVQDIILVLGCPYQIIIVKSLAFLPATWVSLTWISSELWLTPAHAVQWINLGFAADDCGGYLVSSTSFYASCWTELILFLCSWASLALDILSLMQKALCLRMVISSMLVCYLCCVNYRHCTVNPPTKNTQTDLLALSVAPITFPVP